MGTKDNLSVRVKKAKHTYEKALLETYTASLLKVRTDAKKLLTDIGSHVATAMLGIEREYHRGWVVRRDTPLFKELTDHAKESVRRALPALLEQVANPKPSGRWLRSAQSAYKDAFERAANDAIRAAAQEAGTKFAKDWLSVRETETLAEDLKEFDDAEEIVPR